MQKFLFVILLTNLTFFLLISDVKSSNTNTEEFPEISSEEFSQFQSRYVVVSDDGEKKYLEAVVKPEKFDLNKDRKISKEELKEALHYVCYPKDKKAKKTIPAELDLHLRNNIQLYVTNLNFDKLNFKQFSYLMRKITVTQFLTLETVESQMMAKEEKREEGEGDL